MTFSDSADCAICEEALQNLEDIDDDADAVGVRMVKTDDKAFADFIGLSTFPSIVYYEHGNPHIYDGEFDFTKNMFLIIFRKVGEYLKLSHLICTVTQV